MLRMSPNGFLVTSSKTVDSSKRAVEGMGYSRRREMREIAESIRESNQSIAGVILGQICAAGIVVLEVSCHVCPRRGRYRVTRLIDQHGAGKPLPELKDVFSADCSKRAHESFFDRCGVYFPRWKAKI